MKNSELMEYLYSKNKTGDTTEFINYLFRLEQRTLLLDCFGEMGLREWSEYDRAIDLYKTTHLSQGL